MSKKNGKDLPEDLKSIYFWMLVMLVVGVIFSLPFLGWKVFIPLILVVVFLAAFVDGLKGR